MRATTIRTRLLSHASGACESHRWDEVERSAARASAVRHPIRAMASRLQFRLNRGMESHESRRVELVLPLRTILLVVATFAVVAAFVAIGDTFLIIFVGIFLALVFEFP